MEHQQQIQSFIKEELLSYEKTFTRKLARWKCGGDNVSAKVVDLAENSLLSKILLPLNSINDLVECNTAITDSDYLKLMVRLKTIIIFLCIKRFLL